MGENQKQPFQMSFNRFLRVAFQGSRVTSNGGLILVRELDERLGFGKLVEQHLTDPRANNARLSFADLLRQSVYSRLAGYEDVNDAEQLSRDPTFRLIGSEKIWDRGAALPSRLQTFETALLAEGGELRGAGTGKPRADRQGRRDRFAAPNCVGHGLDRDSGLRPAVAECLQRAFRVELLSPVVAVQSRG